VGRTRPGDAGAKVLKAASALFYRDGIHAVGVDTVAAEAGVTKAALYGNFGSKSGLVVAYLRERAVFDAYKASLSRDGYRGCAFLNATSEFPDPADPVREVVRHHKTAMHGYLRAQLQRGEPDRADALADELMLLLEGAAVTAVVAQGAQPFETAKRLARTLTA
jgi:AcrR family transcriptional regulator